MSLPHISPARAKELIDRGAVLVDIREFDEHVRRKIPAARHAPLSRLDKLEIGTDARTVISIAAPAIAPPAMPIA
jgi:rhodanese-related sulfurtransferase